MAYTSIDDPSAYFQTLLYTGNSSSPRDLVNDGNSDLQPDFVWIKGRSHADLHLLYDSSRGAGKCLRTESTAAENTGGYGLTAFNSDGFRTNAYAYSNENTHTYAAWQWKANGGTKGTNSDGSTDATVQVNQDAGFSIVEFTTDGGNETYGHGLGVKPDIVIVKSRSGGGSWIYMTDVIDGSVDYLLLNGTNAAADLSYGAFTSSTFQYNDNNAVTQIAYCFAEKQGYSKFGKYVGNGSSNGTFVYTGFAPAWVMIKDTSQATNWEIFDVKRNPSNVRNLKLGANLAVAENGSDLGTTSQNNIDILSNGFKMRTGNTDTNVSGDTFIFMAFAENPFTTSTGVPCTAR